MILKDIFGFAFLLFGLGLGIIILVLLSQQDVGDYFVIYAGILSAISLFAGAFLLYKSN